MAPSFKKHDGILAVVDCDDWIDFRQKAYNYLVLAPKRSGLSGNYLFRGQSCSSWPLISSYDRENMGLSPAEADQKYDRMMAEFKKAFENYLDAPGVDISHLRVTGGPPKDTELEAIAQHFGIPTRLLDWSHSLYVAAFFAFSKPNFCESGMVSIWSLHMPSLKLFSSKHLVGVMDTYKSNARHLWQWAAFVRNMTGEHDLARLFSAGSRYYDLKHDTDFPSLLRFDIPVASVGMALDDLNSMRINSITIFPGIEGIVQWIRAGGSLPT